MYLRSVQLENYRKFEFAQTDFPDGIVGIIGSNGVGKSTLVEAIAWTLYGNEASRTTKEEIRRLTAKPTDVCRATLEFESAGSNFRVVRQIKGENLTGDASVIVDGNVAARGIKAVKDYVEKTLGMDYKAFITSFYAPQKELNVLSDLQPYRRKELLVRMLGIENIDSALKSLRVDKKELEIKSELTSAHLKDMKSLKSEKKEKDKELNRLHKEVTQIKREHKEVSSSLSNAEAELGSMRKRYEKHHQLNQQLQIKKTEESTLASQLPEKNQEKERLSDLSQRITDLKPQVDEHNKVKKQITEMDQLKLKTQKRNLTQGQIDQLQKSVWSDQKRLHEVTLKLREKQGLEAKLNQSKEKIEQRDLDLERTRKEYVHLQTSFRTLAEDRKKLKKQLDGIQELGPDSVCDRCLRPMGTDYQNIRLHLLKEVDRLESDLSQLKKEKDEVETRGRKLKKERDQADMEKQKIRREWEELLRSVGQEESLRNSLNEKNKTVS